MRYVKNHTLTASLRPIFWILAELAIKLLKKPLDYGNLRKILILFQHWKAWLRSQAFNIGNPKLQNLSKGTLRESHYDVHNELASGETDTAKTMFVPQPNGICP